MHRTPVWLRTEAAAVLALSLVLYARFGDGWATFALLLLLPDLAMLGYLAGPRAGALVYNLAHCYAGPAALAMAAVTLALPWAAPAALIWFAHIALDRALGYGLKLPTSFRDTHLGRIGRADAAPSQHVPVV